MWHPFNDPSGSRRDTSMRWPFSVRPSTSVGPPMPRRSRAARPPRNRAAACGPFRGNGGARGESARACWLTRRPIRLDAEHGCQRVGDVLSLKHPRAREHLVQHAAESPHVAALVRPTSFCLFGTDVRRRAMHENCQQATNAQSTDCSGVMVARKWFVANRSVRRVQYRTAALGPFRLR